MSLIHQLPTNYPIPLHCITMVYLTTIRGQVKCNLLHRLLRHISTICSSHPLKYLKKTMLDKAYFTQFRLRFRLFVLMYFTYLFLIQTMQKLLNSKRAFCWFILLASPSTYIFKEVIIKYFILFLQSFLFHVLKVVLKQTIML